MSDHLLTRPQASALPEPAAPAGPLSQAALAEAPHALSSNTRRAYRDGLKRIEDAIRDDLGLGDDDKVPLNDDTISHALRKLDADELSVSTLSVSVAGVRFAAKLARAPDPVGPSCEMVMKAIRRRAPSQTQVAAVVWQKADLAAALAEQDIPGGGEPTTAGQRDAAVIATMSDCLLRISEVSNLLMSDVGRSHDGSGTLLIRKDKTSKGALAGGTTLYLGPPTVDRIDTWLDAAGLDPAVDHGPLFRKVYKGGHVPRCGHCDRGGKGCCWHNAAPHPCCKHPAGNKRCVDGECCRHSTGPHRCCKHPRGATDCTGTPCCQHLGGCEECRCHVGIGPASVRSIVKARVGAAKVNGRISGHSLRVGSAVSLVRANADLVAVMQAGRWTSSQMVALYTRNELAAKGAVAKLRYNG